VAAAPPTGSGSPLRLPAHAGEGRPARRLAGERGSALIELLVAIPMIITVFGAVASLSGVFGHTAGVTAERSESIAAGQVATDRMTREIRQARSITVVSGQEVRLETYLRPAAGGRKALGTVRYVCQTGVCARSELGSDSTWSPGVTVVDGVTNPTVFSSDQANFVSITLHLDQPGQARDLVVDDGVAVANAAP